MKLHHDFFHERKLSEDQKKKERSSPIIKKFLSPKSREDQKRSKRHPALSCRPQSNYWGDADVEHSQIIGGDAVKLLGMYPSISPLPGFRHPRGQIYKTWGP